MSTYLGSRNPKYVSTSGGCTSSFRHRGLRVVAVFGTSHDLVQATGNVWRSEMLVTCFALVLLRDTLQAWLRPSSSKAFANFLRCCKA